MVRPVVPKMCAITLEGTTADSQGHFGITLVATYSGSFLASPSWIAQDVA